MPTPDEKPLFEGSEIYVGKNGYLRSSYDCVDYEAGSNRVVMDGTFDAQELRAIADHMEKHDK